MSGMSYKYAEKRDRNERLRRYHAAHPDMTMRALAGVFKISSARVCVILNKGRGEDATGDSPREKREADGG